MILTRQAKVAEKTGSSRLIAALLKTIFPVYVTSVMPSVKSPELQPDKVTFSPSLFHPFISSSCRRCEELRY
ncbi:hypothetical protein JOB18_043837 [Solea senegalensis]|uniref:Uncharacterized protein n=1 Tax=Solea senegalensis TaxID=28829 RepID=A0AAV6SC22_SOLSE|nr:hypothetical protein JOB18_043837 [Solea senegalensis]